MKSGIYYEFGGEVKDLITEATAQEFRDWVSSVGPDISYMSDATLNGSWNDQRDEFLQWQIRYAFITDLQHMGVIVNKQEQEWEVFQKEYEKRATERYG